MKFSVVFFAVLGAALASNYNGVGPVLVGGYNGALVGGIGPVYGGPAYGRWIGNGIGGRILGGYGPGLGYGLGVGYGPAIAYGPAVGYGVGIGAGYGGALDYYSYPRYNYEYGVNDYLTGDRKGQWEVRDGDVVKGQYALDEADGTRRIVQYYADGRNGFAANVKNVGPGPVLGGLSAGLLGGGLRAHYGGVSYSNVDKLN